MPSDRYEKIRPKMSDFIQFLRSLAKFLRLRADPPVAVRRVAARSVPPVKISDEQSEIGTFRNSLVLLTTATPLCYVINSTQN